MDIDKKLYNSIKEYCDLNNMDTSEYINKLLKKAFMEDKYGKVPPFIKGEGEKKSKPKSPKAVEVVSEENYVKKEEEVKTEKQISETKETDTSKKIVKTVKRSLNE